MRCSIFFLIMLAAVVDAGELIFHNEDVLKGEVVSIHPSHIVWISDAIGQVNVPKNSILEMSTSRPLKRVGVNEVCYWVQLDGLDALLQCEGDEVERITFASLKEVVVYEGYASIAHTYEGRLTGVGTESNGNKNSQDWLLDIDIALRHYEYRHTAGLKYEAEALDEERLQEEFEGTYTLAWFFSRRIFLSTAVSARTDDARDIDARYSLGSGLGYQLFDTTKSAFSVESGVEYIYERSEDQTLPTETFLSWRTATKYRYLFPRSTAFYFNANYLHSADDTSDWEVETEAGMSLPVVMGITADLRYEYDYDNTPQDDLSSADSTLRLGFGYKW